MGRGPRASDPDQLPAALSHRLLHGTSVPIQAVGQLALPADVPNYGLVLFAKLDDGRTIRDPKGYTTTIAPGDQAKTLVEFKAAAIMGVHGLSAMPDARKSQWSGVLTALRDVSVETDAETLMSLEYEVTVDEEVARDFEGG